jgi:hypothetical protein
MWLYIITSAILWFLTIFLFIMYLAMGRYWDSLWAFIAFWFYPFGLELLLNIWGFWAGV